MPTHVPASTTKAGAPTTGSVSVTVPGVPAGPPFYLVGVGGHGAYTYSAAHLQTRRVDLRLGD